MFKKTLLPLTAVAALALSSFANAKDGAYVSGSIGTTFSSKITVDDTGTSTKLDLKTGMPFSIAAGYNYQDFSFGGSYTYFQDKTKTDADNPYSVKIKTSLLLANAAYNFNKLHDVVKPYVGVGLGFGQTKARSEKYKMAFAYQISAGSNFQVHENVQLFADLRYTGIAKGDNKNDSTISVKTQYYSLNFGAKYNF